MSTAQQFDLQARAHTSRVLGSWLAERDGGIERAGLAPQVQDSALVSSGDTAGMLRLFAPIQTASGYAVTDYTAMLVSTVYSCLTVKAGAVSQLPVQQYRLDRLGDREQMEPNAIWWLLNEQPADAWTAASWKEWIVRCVALRGRQVTEIKRKPTGAPMALLPHHPDCVQVRRDPDRPGHLRYDVFDVETGRSYGLQQEDVLDFVGFGFDGLDSPSVIKTAARNAVANSLAASEFAGKTLGEGAMPQIALTYPNKLDKDQAALLRESFVATYGNRSGSRKLPLILTEGGTAKELTLSPEDLQLLDSRRFEREDICQALGVPPVMIGENAKTSSWGTGVEQITLGFVKFRLKPELRRWTEEINRKLYRRAGTFAEFDLEELLRGDSKQQADVFRAAIGGPGVGNGYATVNEIRRIKNMRPKAGGDELYRVEKGATAAAPAPAPTPAPGPAEPDADDEDPQQ